MRNLYIADWHYGHKNILALDNRPFVTVEEMNQALIDNWNVEVKPEDTVYVLGDMFWCKPKEAAEVLKLLNGHKVLIRGNHDRVGDRDFDRCFDRITDYLEISDEGRRVVLSHYPMPCFKNHFRGWYHLYGHVHNTFEHNMMLHDRFLMEELYGHPCKMYNVGAMMPWIGYIPRPLDTIIYDFAEWREANEKSNASKMGGGE